MSADRIETLAFVLGIALFELAERLVPARRVDRRATLRADLAALGMLIVTASLCRAGLRALVDASGLSAPLAGLPFALQALIGFLVIDLAQYWLHRAMHAFAPLWRAHAFHHGPHEVHWLSGFRTSVVHAALFAIPQTLVPHALLGLGPYETATGYAVGALLQLWTHANVRVGGPWLERLLVTPRYHRAHHSSRPDHQRRNLAMIFPLWDHLFGTWLDPARADAERLGLDPPPPPRSWLGL